jgi:enoyl-CoA hydratase
MRALYYTASTIDAEALHRHGSVYRVVPRADLDAAALELARQIAAKDPRVIRRAKEAINGIDPQDVHRSYRYEQGFTFELNLTDAPDQARNAFLRNGGER